MSQLSRFARVRRMGRLAVLVLAIAIASGARAWDDVEPPSGKRNVFGLHLLAFDAYALVLHNQSRVLFIDVRSPPEVELLGMPRMVDANVPYLVHASPNAWDDERSGLALARNPAFVRLVDRRLKAKGLARSDTVILICRSGTIGPHAAEELAKAGFARVYTVIDGFEGDQIEASTPSGKRALNGWKVSGLPWFIPTERRHYSFARQDGD
jgi:rhodanese-related sulfurtransferase